MIVYIEGPDGTGKTTLAHNIDKVCAQHGISCLYGEPLIQTNPTKPGRVSETELVYQLVKMLRDDEVVYILDRGPISDCVYRAFDDYEPVMPINWLMDIFGQFRNKIVFIYANNANAEYYMLQRGDDNPVAIAKHQKISYAYEMLKGYFSKTFGKIFYYDFEKTDVSEFSERIYEEIERKLQGGAK